MMLLNKAKCKSYKLADLIPLMQQAADALASAAAQVVVPPNAITAAIVRDDGGEAPAYCLMAAYRSEKDAMDAFALIAAAPAKPAAQQGVAYAALPEPYCNAHDDADACYPDMFSEHQMRAFADATHALRASHGQASSQAGEYPALVCDYCGALTPDPWHSSGMLHGKMSKHIHSCDACAARGVANGGNK